MFFICTSTMIIASAASKDECDACFKNCVKNLDTTALEYKGDVDNATIEQMTGFRSSAEGILREYFPCSTKCFDLCGCNDAEKLASTSDQSGADLKKCKHDEEVSMTDEIRAATKANDGRKLVEIVLFRIPSTCIYSACNKNGNLVLILAIVGGVALLVVLIVICVVCYCLLADKKDAQVPGQPQLQYIGHKPKRNEYQRRRW